MSINKKENSVVGQILATVLIALIAGGTAPWWWEPFFGNKIQTSVSPPEPPENLPISSPERSLNLYTQSLTNRDFSELARIHPIGNQNSIGQWQGNRILNECS